MALNGRLREGAGGSGVAPLSLGGGPVTFVSGSVFGCGVTTGGQAIAACTFVRGVANAPPINGASRELRLVTLTADGRGKTPESGPLGEGIWFEAKDGDRYAIGQRSNRFIIVKHWGTPSADAEIADTMGADSGLATALLNGQFCAGIAPGGRLIVIGGGLIFSVGPGADVERLNWASVPRGVQRMSSIRRLVFREPDQMFLITTLARRRGKRILRFLLEQTSITADPAWGRDGAWIGPPAFEPSDLLVHPAGGFVCVGWTAVTGGVELTAIRIADDGIRASRFFQAGTIPQPYPFYACVDANGGLLLAATGPNPLSIFLGGLAEVGWVTRWTSQGQIDATFGNQGVCLGWHLGYPITVRGVVPTSGGFFLACDRPVSIDPQFPHTLPVILAFDQAGQTIPAFGETGIAHHDGIPTVLQLHDASGALAVGKRRVWGPPGQSELAVTTAGSGGSIIWRYGTTHGMQSGPVVINGQRTDVFYVNAVVRWGSLIAIGGNANFAGFVTIRSSDGKLLPPGTTSFVQLPSPPESLEAIPNGALEATYRTPNGMLEKVRLVSTPSLMIDPAFPPTPVPYPFPFVYLPNGSIIKPNYRVSSFSSPNTLTLWLTRELPVGGIDPDYGGGTNAIPTGRFVEDETFSTIARVEFPTFITLPNGEYFLVARILRVTPQLESEGVVAMAFRPNDGAPNPQWLNPFVSSTFVTVSEVLSDGNDGIVLVGSADRTATLLRIRTLDGSPDSGFGNNGVLSVPLRSAQRPMGDSENQVARPLVDQANGIQRVPVIFESDDANPFLEQSKELTFAWFDTT